LRRPDAGEERQGAGFVQGEPCGLQRSAGLVRLAKRREWDEATVLGSEPALPVAAGGVSHVSRALVRLHPKRLIEVDLLALLSKLVGSLARGVDERLLRGRHAPPHHRQLTAIGPVAHDWRRVIREDPRQRRQIAGPILHHPRELADRLLALGHRVEIAHAVEGATLRRRESSRRCS